MLSFRLSFLAVSSLFLLVTSFETELEDRERYWNGPPQAIGIDLSPTVLIAVQYNATTKEYVNLASIDPPEQYVELMFALFQRQKVISQNHYAAWSRFARWSWYRGLVSKTKAALSTFQLTAWIGEYIPSVLEDHEWRFPLNDSDLDSAIIPLDGNPSWLSWTQRFIPGYSPRDILPVNHVFLTRTTLLTVFTSALTALSTEIHHKTNITLTSCVLAKPESNFGHIDAILELAAQRANIELLAHNHRSELALNLAIAGGAKHPLIVEQSPYGFAFREPGMSGDRNELAASWIPSQLVSGMLAARGNGFKGTEASLNDGVRRLARLVAWAQTRMRCENAPCGEVDAEAQEKVVVPDFGVQGFTLEEMVRGKDVIQLEGQYAEKVQDTVEGWLLKHDVVARYLPHDDPLEDRPRQEVTVAFARTITPPEEVGSWWRDVDAAVVLASFPDNTVIRRGLMKGLEGNPGFGGEMGRVYAEFDIAARGAAVDAMRFLEGWDEKLKWEEEAERWRRWEAEEGKYPGDYDSEDQYEGGVEHGKL